MNKELNTSALALAPEKTKTLKRWGAYAYRKIQNRQQQESIWRNAKSQKDLQKLRKAINAGAALNFCNSRIIVEKIGEEYQHAGAWYCGKKYCAHCSHRKRRKILNRFIDFFNSEEGREMLKSYDLGLFTVTLKHNNRGLRSEPYYSELSKHFANAMKYGKFRQYIAGGFYNTEHTYTRNGHHIHRHALILVPKRYDLRENFELITEELKQQWASRTGGSFQVDLRPLGYNELTETTPTDGEILNNLNKHLLEVTKYITKRDNKGSIHYKIVEAIEENSRAKFYGRFGILHRIKALKINQDQEVEVTEAKAPRQLFIGTPVVKRKTNRHSYKKPKYKKQVTTKNGVKFVRVVKSGEISNSYEFKTATSYTIKDLIPIADNKEEFTKFKENIRDLVYNWKLNKWAKLINGETVEKWKESREALRKYREKYNFEPIVKN